jgi:hypothetical protein
MDEGQPISYRGVLLSARQNDDDVDTLADDGA